MIKRKL